MKDTLKRMLGISQAPAQAETLIEGVVEMTDAVIIEGTIAADSIDKMADASGLQDTVNSLAEQLTAANEKIAELSALVEAAVEFKAAQELAAAEAKVSARVEALIAIVGTEQAASLHAATAALDDNAFAAMTAAMTFKQNAEAATPAFKEVGAEGSTDQAKLAAEVYGGKTGDYLQNLIATNQLN